MTRPRWYILAEDLKTPKPSDLFTAGRLLETDAPRRVARTDFEGGYVSTVFLCYDHNYYGEGPALLWETMIFGGDLDGSTWRYATYDEAVQGHAQAVVQAQAGAPVPDL